MNMLNVEKRDFDTNVNIRKKKLEMNLLNVEKRGWQRDVNVQKKKITNTTVADKVRKFHAAVSEGPMCICYCCDQLWYKHSVTTAEKLRVSNPSVIKCLLSKLSVDDMEWVCQSCYKHLHKNKIPPCAIKNGMSFPVNLSSLT